MNIKIRSFAFLMLAAFGAGCAPSGPDKSGGLKIVIRESMQALGVKMPEFKVQSSSPSTTADFMCFAVNITGPGVPAESEKLSGCTSPDNMHGHGFGIITEPVARNQVIEVDVPAGLDRNIDVYGIFPADHCPGQSGGGSGGGSDGGYFLGGTTQNLSDNTTVVVPISYNGASPTVLCQGGGSTPHISSLFPYGGGIDVAAGTAFNVNGGGFASGATVSVGNQNCPVNSNNGNTINCTLSMASASSLGTGNHTVTVNNGNGTTLTASQQFTVGPSTTAFISAGFNTGNVDFGSVSAVSGTSSVSLLFANTGNASEPMSPTYPNGDFSDDNGCSTGLAVGSFCTFVVTFDPSTTGNRGGGVTLLGLGVTLVATGF